MKDISIPISIGIIALCVIYLVDIKHDKYLIYLKKAKKPIICSSYSTDGEMVNIDSRYCKGLPKGILNLETRFNKIETIKED